MDVYRRHITIKFKQSLQNTQELQAWTVDYPQEFWIDLYGYLDLVPPLPSTVTKAYEDSVPISSVPIWFDGLRLNYTENVLRNADIVPNQIALIGVREGGPLGGEERLT